MAGIVPRGPLRPLEKGVSYLIYVDDSGGRDTSIHAGLLIPADRWALYLGERLKYRKRLYRKHGVPARFELKASNWLTGKDVPVPGDTGNPINTSRGLRQELSVSALRAVRSMQGARIITRQTPTAVKADAYADFIGVVDQALLQDDAWGIVVMDGLSTNPDPHLKRVHRALPLVRRRVLEDSWVQDSSSQLIQIADLIAHCAFQAHKRDRTRQFMWDWYCELLHDLERHCACPSSVCGCGEN